MSTILDIIVSAKKREVEELKSRYSRNHFRDASPGFSRNCFSLKDNLARAGSTGIIAEFKRKSPSKGWFKPADYPAAEVVKNFELNGAAAVSVLTDAGFFGGSREDLAASRELSGLPLLRKDFIIDEIQLYESKAYGADVILLIAAILSPEQVRELAGVASTLGMEVLLELHDEDELGHICDEITLIGINNRNLKTFEVDIARSLRMAARLPKDKILIAESGISLVEDIILFRQHGFQGFLIGENFMKAADPTIAFADFIEQLKAKAHES
jgi:indole-3-glycerol phosphate synthase